MSQLWFLKERGGGEVWSGGGLRGGGVLHDIQYEMKKTKEMRKAVFMHCKQFTNRLKIESFSDSQHQNTKGNTNSRCRYHADNI